MITKVTHKERVKRKGSRSANLLIALTLMMMLGSVLSPIMGPTSAETISTDGPNTEASVAEEVVSEVLEEELLPSAIHINLYWCDDAVDVASAPDSSSLTGTCQEQGPATTVTLASVNGNSANASQSVSGFPGGVSFTSLIADDWNIAVDPGMDVSTSAFFCNGKTPTSITKSNASYASIYENKPTYALDTLDEEEIYCDWFGSLPTDFNATVSVKLTKWNCPAGFDFANAGYDAATTTCWEPVNPSVQFTYTDLNDEDDPNDDDVQVQSTDPNANDSTTFTSTGAAKLIISETIPAGYELTAVHCSFDGQTPVKVSLDDETSFHLFVKGDEQIECDVFDTFVSDDTATTSETGYGDIYISKYACDTDVPADADMNWFTLNCSTPQNGATFTLETPNGNVQTNTGNTGTDGFAMMGMVEAGTYPLTEKSPMGYELTAAYCAYDSDSIYKEAAITNGTMNVDVVADDILRCNFFNAKINDGVTITIYKWECPDGTTYNQAYGYYQSMCATKMPGVPFHVTDANTTIDTTSDTNGRTITGLDRGPNERISILEDVPADFGMPVVYCQYVDSGADPQDIPVTNGAITLPVQFETAEIECFWFNLPYEPSSVVINKWECPGSDLYNEGFHSEDEAMTWHKDNCTMPMDGVNFSLVNAANSYMGATVNGMITFDNIATGLIQIKESIPAGFSNQPFLICQNTYADGSSSSVYWATTINGTYNTAIDEPGTTIVCDWYNHPVGQSEVTVYKWTCPEGYDRTAWGANPMTDCTQATNGITFRLIQPAPMPELQSNTGDSVSGAVYFGGLEPGSYSLEEMVDASAMKDVFVWQCYGLTTSSVQPTPLNTGARFDFSISGGEKITCHWFNVPKTPHGWIDVSKFNCTTEKYVADVYCYTNQTGQEFNLQKFDGTNWNTIASGITDVNGKLTFPGLDEGDYRLVEPNKDACMIKSSNITPNKNIGVKKGEGTTVYVYNCKTPPPPNDTPKKYPNTGVDPESAASVQRTPGVEAAGLLGLAGLSLSRRRFLKRAAGAVTLGAGTVAGFASAQDLLPLDSTPVPATPGANVLGCGTPTAMTNDAIIEPISEGTPTWEDPCLRGPVPLRFRVPIIGVDAAVEYLEIIDGQMQPPSGADDVTWYKETSRLGEVGNGIYAGHLNYWGIPEGVFFRLESLKEGDVIEIDGIDAKTYSYIVQWSQNFPSDEEPPEEALGTTNERAITVITCGGEWVSSRAEYDHRTLVRAVQMEDPV